MNDIAYPIAAIRDDGTTIIARTPEEAIRLRNLRPGPKHADAYTAYDGTLSFTRHEWIVRDAFGRTVHEEELPYHERGPGWRGRRAAIVSEAVARGLPIPGVGRRRYSHNRRSYRTNISMRAAEAGLAGDLEDWGVEAARVGRTRARDLPQVWDDVAWRGSRRCWKSCRATQWR